MDRLRMGSRAYMTIPTSKELAGRVSSTPVLISIQLSEFQIFLHDSDEATDRPHTRAWRSDNQHVASYKR